MTAEPLAPDDGRWDELVDASPTPDVYFRTGYCAAYEAAGEGQLVALRAPTALFPLLLRELPYGQDGFDAVPPFGYGGILPLDEGGNLHALEGVFELDWVERREHGPTSAVELARVADGRLAGMSKGRKADLNVARRELEVAWDAGEGALERFRAVYDETMIRLGASQYYLFPPQYYRALADGLGDLLGVALARRADEVVGGALFLADAVGAFAHYHLSGASDVGRKLKAGTLLVHEGAMWAAERSCEVLHLGGGATGDDSLYAFKRSFGGEEHTYSLAAFVADADRYRALVARRAEDPEPPRPGFFPAYRA